MKEHAVDRSTWDSGPWDNEPDRIEWRYQGLPCLIVRNSMGALCGYVGVPEGHPWYRKDYGQVDADVHGGLTYADHCCDDTPICHVPQPGESDNVWWLGFDCAHSFDYVPKMDGFIRQYMSSYKDVPYVRSEVESLVRQAMGCMQGK